MGDPQRIEPLFDITGRLLLLEREFGMGVQMASEFDGGYLLVTFHITFERK